MLVFVKKNKIYKYNSKRVGLKISKELKDEISKISEISKVSINNLIVNKIREKGDM